MRKKVLIVRDWHTCSIPLLTATKEFNSCKNLWVSSALEAPNPEISTKKLFPKSLLVTFSPSMTVNWPIPKKKIRIRKNIDSNLVYANQRGLINKKTYQVK